MDLASRYERVKSSIPSRVKLIAVSKARTVEEIQALYDLGQRAFGENYPQELKEKQVRLPQDIEWHFIGHLQTNKVKMIAAFVHLIHSVDSEKLLDEINKRALGAGRVIDVLLQAHVAREATKHGWPPDQLRAWLKTADPRRWPQLCFRGLMGMATDTEDNDLIRTEFRTLAALHREIREGGPFDARTFDQLSMGMTSDLGIAVEEGSDLVRVGTAIFGPRE